MKNKETKTTRISEWVYRLFSDKAVFEDTSFIKKLDEVAEMLHLLDVKEVILNNFLHEAYKNDELNTPRYVYESLSALMNYWYKLNDNSFNQNSFNQFIDRWNILSYYISCHIYTNVLSKNSLSDDELKQRAESSASLVFLFGKEIDGVLECVNDIMNSLDPYSNATICKESKALILTKIFEHEKLTSYLENELIIRKETTLNILFKQLSEKYSLAKDRKSAFSTINTAQGIPNKIAYLMYYQYKNDGLAALPYFVDEIFLSEMFTLLHKYVSSYYFSDLYDARALESAFRIAQVIKNLNKYNHDDSYLKSNLENSNKFNEFDKALQADIISLQKTKYTYDAEMRMRTPMLIVEQTTKTGTRYVQREEIKEIILKNLINLCYPLYNAIVKVEGVILHFREDSNTTITSDDNSSQIVVSMKEDAYYVSLILSIEKEATITINMKHDSIEKIHHCIQLEKYSTTKIEKNLTFYYDKKDVMKLFYNQGCIFIHGKTKDSLINVIAKYVESSDFVRNKKLDILNYGLM